MCIWLGTAHRAFNRRPAPRERALMMMREPFEAAEFFRDPILQLTLASIGDAVIVTDVQGRVRFLNAVAESLTGWQAAAARNQPLGSVFRIVNERTRQPVEDPAAKVLQSGAVIGLANHTTLLSKSGREIPIDDSAAPIRAADGELVGVVMIFRDITEQRQAQRARAWLSAIVESSSDAIVSKTLEGVITSWNPAAVHLFGYTPEEIIGKPITTIIPKELHSEEGHILARLRRGERLEHFETVRVAKDGHRIEVSLTVSPIKDEDGTVIGASKIARDITPRKRSERLLREANLRKDEFLATLGHELRNPLAPIRNVAEVLSAAELGKPELQAACDILGRQVRVLNRLVDDLLDVSRISSGRLTLRLEPVELAQLLMGTVDSIRHALEEKSQVIELSFAGETLVVLGDRTRLTQVFSNVLQNANKYTPEGGRIEIGLRREGGTAVVTIRDNGIGIPPAMLEEIFELFSQVGRSYDRPDGGLGIGLTLSRRLLGMHGGSIEARSDGEGRGSEFVVRLPATEAAQSAPAAKPSAALRSRRVLIADDNVDAATSLAMLLESMGHETHVVHDGVAAVRAVGRLQPDIVFLDLAMPRLDGCGAALRIRKLSLKRPPVLVALTGRGQDVDRERTREAGFHRHLVKPIDPDILQDLLTS
jgi:PAS domain S-box-containing protein